MLNLLFQFFSDLKTSCFKALLKLEPFASMQIRLQVYCSRVVEKLSMIVAPRVFGTPQYGDEVMFTTNYIKISSKMEIESLVLAIA